MKYFNALIKPASSLCNLKCQYCFYNDEANNRNYFSYGLMSKEVTKTVIDKILSLFQEEVLITFAFQGGEPTVIGLDYYRNFITYVNKRKSTYHHISYSIQTNGTLLDENWLNFFKENDFLVGISLDGFKENHDIYRIDKNGNPTFSKVLSVINMMKKKDITYNVLTVLTSKLAKQPKRLFNFYLHENFKYIQIVPCLPQLNIIKNKYSLSANDFLNFYDSLIDLWLKELKKGNYISFNYFDNLILLFSNKLPCICGSLGYCTIQFVVEADGSVYPCDFYCLDQFKLGNILTNDINKMIFSKQALQFLNESKQSYPLCLKCRYRHICHGNCKRMNSCYINEKYCGLKEFMDKHEKDILLAIDIIYGNSRLNNNY